jgi:hypothetical protein
MQHCPNATLLAHPRAAPHVIDPSRLVASAKQVWGEDRFASIYGEIVPVSKSRVRIMKVRFYLLEFNIVLRYHV